MGKKDVTEYPLNSIIASVVSVYCPVAGNMYNEGFWGSGTIWWEDGTITTNSHIVPQKNGKFSIAEEGCIITLPDPITGKAGDMYLARPSDPDVSAINTKYDFLNLEIYAAYIDSEGKSHGTYPRVFPAYNPPKEVCPNGWGYQTPVKLGDKVRVFGYPGTSGNTSITLTEGIVSNIPDDGATILTSAKIDSGNSGGLAVDTKGCAIGIPSAVHLGEYENLGVIVNQTLYFKAMGDLFESILSNRNAN